MRLTGAIHLIEQGYDLQRAPSDWLAAVLAAAAPALDTGCGLVGLKIKLGAGRFELSEAATHGDLDPRVPSQLAAFNANAPTEAARFFNSKLVSFETSHRLFAGRTGAYYSGFASTFGYADSLALYAQDGEGHSLFLCTFSRTPLSVHGHARRAWERVGLHLGAAIRLRRHVREGDQPIARFDARGVPLHLEAEAQRPDTRALLVEAVRSVEKARGRLRRNPSEALELWRGLIDGRFSLVESLESDGRRLLVVHRNAPGLGDPRALSPKERTLLSYLTHAASNAQIGYAMGLDASSVASVTRKLLRKLKVPNREALLAFREPAMMERLPIALRGQVLEILAAPIPRPDDARLMRLTPAQRRISLRVVAGASDAAIASELGLSTRTVSNQLRLSYAKAGVGNRSSLVRWLTQG